jgi:hypothetical protein
MVGRWGPALNRERCADGPYRSPRLERTGSADRRRGADRRLQRPGQRPGPAHSGPVHRARLRLAPLRGRSSTRRAGRHLVVAGVVLQVKMIRRRAGLTVEPIPDLVVSRWNGRAMAWWSSSPLAPRPACTKGEADELWRHTRIRPRHAWTNGFVERAASADHPARALARGLPPELLHRPGRPSSHSPALHALLQLAAAPPRLSHPRPRASVARLRRAGGRSLSSWPTTFGTAMVSTLTRGRTA